MPGRSCRFTKLLQMHIDLALLLTGCIRGAGKQCSKNPEYE